MEPSLATISNEPAVALGAAAKTDSGWRHVQLRSVRSNRQMTNQKGPLQQRGIVASPTCELEPEHSRKRCPVIRKFLLFIASPFRRHFSWSAQNSRTSAITL